MNAVLFAAGSIAAATFLGSVLGMLLTNLQRKTYLYILAIAAGVMLCAAVQGLLMPALEQTSGAWACIGIVLGAVGLYRLNLSAARLLCLEENAIQLHGMMFVFAIAVHHLPEGLAAGVSFGSGDTAETVSVCAAIALQNIPEAMMIVPAMAGFSRKKAVFAAAASGAVEIIGLLMGYIAVQIAVQVLPVLLSLAAGAMLYVIFENMLPDGYENGGRTTTVGVLTGYCCMILLSELIAMLL